MSMRWLPAFPALLSFLMLAACTEQAPPAPAPARTTGDNSPDYGAVSVDQPKPRRQVDISKTSEWPDATLESGSAHIVCSDDPTVDPATGQALKHLGYFSVVDAMLPCKDAGVVRLHYKGRVAGDFTSLVERVGNMTQRMGIPRRILDLDSSGGQVEDAIRAGDILAGGGWTLWVREGAVCHSACVLLLAGGDDRLVSGAVGIHRIIRIESEATSRSELREELHEVHDQMKDYLERNGAGVAVADFMMTVPNRSLRLLTQDELVEFGLSGRNAAQEDLDRIRLVRRCGLDFVRRLDAYQRAFDRQCVGAVAGGADGDSCNAALLTEFGFPDEKCPADGPVALAEPVPAAPADAAAATR